MVLVRTSVQLGIQVDLHTSEAYHMLYPPTRTCLGCKSSDTLQNQPLGEDLTHEITVFTLEYGGVPGFLTSLYCRREYLE